MQEHDYEEIENQYIDQQFGTNSNADRIDLEELSSQLGDMSQLDKTEKIYKIKKQSVQKAGNGSKKTIINSNSGC